MYDRPETRPAWDRIWAHFRHAWDGADCPECLTWDNGDAAHWLRPDLFLSQTCSLPYRTVLHGKVSLVGAFDFGLPDCPSGYYNSVIVMRRDDARHAPGGLRLAYNSVDSQSGWAAVHAHFASTAETFSACIETGAHARSAACVADGTADIAAIDAQTYRLLTRYAPFTKDLVEIVRTVPTPGLPLIAAEGADVVRLRGALNDAIENLSRSDCALLDLGGIENIPHGRYMNLPLPPAPPRK